MLRKKQAAVGRLKKVCRNRREVAVASIYPMLLKNHSSMLLDTASTVLINSDGASYCSLRKASLSVPQERRSSQDSKNLPDSSQDGEVRLILSWNLYEHSSRRTKSPTHEAISYFTFLVVHPHPPLLHTVDS